MKVGDALYFSPKFKFSELDFDNNEMVVEAFRDRVEGFYLQPAARSLERKDAFAGGLVCCAAVEFIAKIPNNRSPSEWLTANISDFRRDTKLATRFWDDFRDGLAHEGRVKSFGQFSLELPDMLTPIGAVLIVNPRLLLVAVQTAFQRLCEKMDGGQAAFLATRLRRYFDAEVKSVTRRLSG